MPYIINSQRERLDPAIWKLIIALKKLKWNVGCLNYVITRILWEYFREEKCYKTINDIVGVLGCVKSEFQRRKVGPYEDEKIAENGDIYAWYET